MKHSIIGIGLALVLAVGCKPAEVKCPNGQVDTETSTLATGEGGYCRYYNTHGKGTDCRYYEGDWTQDEIRLDCTDAMGQGMAKPGTLSNEECDPAGLVGTCTVDRGTGRLTITKYYLGDAGILKSWCENEGVWTPSGPILAGVALAMPEALDALESDTAVAVEPNCQDTDCLEEMWEADKWFEFRPLAAPKDEGVIFFPGGAVDPRAYAPAARAFAEAGYFTVIAPHYASTAKKVAAIAAANPAHADWFMGGHSYGGIATIRYVYADPAEEVVGIFLWAAGGSSYTSIAEKELDALVISAEHDLLFTSLEVESGKKYLPEGTVYEMIAGGNHAQFGYYGEQDSDGEATITREAQQSAAIGATLELFEGTL